MKRFTKILFSVSVALFMCGVALGLLGRAICTRSNEDYKNIMPESRVPDVIETVLHDEDLKQIYVCYNDANCVNVYTETGTFLWCVATPYMRNSCFELQDNKLIIYDADAYIYDSKSGAFLGVENEEDLNLSYNREKEYSDDFTEGDYYFDSFQVYKAVSKDTLEVIVDRPWWNHIFNFSACFSITFIGAVGIGISRFIDMIKDYNKARKNAVFKTKKAKVIKNYFKITTIVHFMYVALNIACAFFTDWMIIGIFPLTVHTIISLIVLGKMKDNLSCNHYEMEVIDFWGGLEFGSFVIAFISVIIASSIAV